MHTPKKNLKKPIIPEEFTGLKEGPIPEYATGLKAIQKSLEHIAREAGYSRGMPGLFKMNQKNGFDCSGCAWPDPVDRSPVAEYCENGAKALAEEATKAIVDRTFFEKNSIAEMQTWSDFELGKSGRITQPMLLEENATHYKAVSWDEAFSHFAKGLQALPTPDQAIFYTSGRTSNEAAFLYQLFVRQYGTNNLPDCSNMCHESSGKALDETIGIGKGTVKLPDFNKADLVIVIGQNPGTNHPRMLSALQQTKQHGGRVISINPLPEVGLKAFKHPQHPKDILGKPTIIADIHVPVAVNGDVAILKAFLKYLIDEEARSPEFVLDKKFIKEHTHGYEDFVSNLNAYDIHDLVAQSGVPFSIFNEAAALIAKSKKIIICWAMGITQHKNAVDNIREAVNLLLLKGSIGIEGGGVCPVRGHSNVQGDRTMGIWEQMSDEFLDKLGNVFNFSPPRKHGHDVVNSIKAMHSTKGMVFVGMGGNFVSATPDTEMTAKALKNCSMTVHISTKLNRSHVVHGKTALILPCLGRSEKDLRADHQEFLTVENSMGIIHSSEGKLSPIAEDLLSEPEIVARMAMATLGSDTTVDWKRMIENYDHIRDAIAKVIPGCENYNTKVRQPDGFYLPNAAREREFKTHTGKANFTTNALSTIETKDGEFIMMTIRSHDQFNTTIYGLDDRYRGVYNERRVLFMNPKDMVKAKLKEKQIVHLVSNYGKIRKVNNFLVVSYPIPQRCVATYFPEANPLIPIDEVAHGSNTPASKSIIIRVETE